MTALASPKPPAPAEGRVLLHGVSWETYERLLEEHNESAGPRFTYDDGYLEIMTLSIEHEDPNRTLSSLVELILGEWDVDFRRAGSNTFKSSELKKGFEPDTSFYIEHAAAVRGRKRLDLAVDPPPDLVIEIEVTEPLLPRLPIFASVRVPEIWCCTGEIVRILRLERGRYREVKRSGPLSPLTAELITDFLRRSSSSKSPAWMRSVREWAQAQRR
jgi:Uma2 family endonuclease